MRLIDWGKKADPEREKKRNRKREERIGEEGVIGRQTITWRIYKNEINRIKQESGSREKKKEKEKEKEKKKKRKKEKRRENRRGGWDTKTKN